MTGWTEVPRPCFTSTTAADGSDDDVCLLRCMCADEQRSKYSLFGVIKTTQFLTRRKMQLSFSVVERLTNVHLLLQCREVGRAINTVCLPRQGY